MVLVVVLNNGLVCCEESVDRLVYHVPLLVAGSAVQGLHCNRLGHDDDERGTHGHPIAVESASTEQSPVSTSVSGVGEEKLHWLPC